MLENALRDTASWQTKKEEELYIVSSPCLGDHQCKQEELESVGDILWSVNKLARAVKKWTQACDRRLARLISHIHHTNDVRRYCHGGNTAQHCGLGFLQDSDFAGDLENSKKKSTSGRDLWKPNVCPHQLDVQEANVSIPQFHRI